nr:protein aurora borealis [Leptinotarsa decemlineata]
MDFKYINDRNKTPKAKTEMFSSTGSSDSPFKLLPNYSTPPSRFCKIVNPFERHLIDRLHLPTFSPSVFAKVSTPKSEEKFKWTIDDISSLKPADIDEETISQHVFEEDPQIESMVQEKIDKFFSEKVIVPSPMTEVVRVPLVADDFKDSPSSPNVKQYSQNSAQTVLTFPPTLPPHVEEVLKPYFTHTEDQQKTTSDMKDTSLYRHLFEFDQSPNRSSGTPSSVDTSPALSTGMSPIQYSPFESHSNKRESLPSDIPELRECSLSPILRSKESRSACRLSFSSKMGMSVDSSLIVPDIADQMSSQSVFTDSKDNSLQPIELLSDSTVNWEMEYRHVSLVSRSSSPDSEKMDVSNSNTPHSKIFTSQRKRLSHSFKDEDDYDKENEMPTENIRQNRKLFKNDVTDAGYHTNTATSFDESVYTSNVFASTPTKRKEDNQ